VKVDDFSVDAEALDRRHMDWFIPKSYCNACSCEVRPSWVLWFY